MSQDETQVKIRLPADLKSELEEVAKANNRSVNGEIVSRLRRSLEPPTELRVRISDGKIILDRPEDLEEAISRSHNARVAQEEADRKTLESPAVSSPAPAKRIRRFRPE